MADSLGELLRRPAKGFFMTVHVAGEDEGEIEPEFYIEFKEEFGYIWRLYDMHGLQHSVEIEPNDAESAVITTGWGFLREHYNFVGHHQILFKYFGGNEFQIIPTMEPTYPSKFPTWHSLSACLRKAVAFEMKITDDVQQTLPEEMGEFMQNTGLDEVWLVGTNGEKHQCIFRYSYPPLVVTIERGWPEVLGINNLKVGDWVVFHIFDIYKDHFVFVRKLGEPWMVERVHGS